MFSQTRTRSPIPACQPFPSKKKTPDYTPSDGEPRKKLTVPVGNVLVGDTGGNIEHDDTTLAVDVVSIAQTTELLLTSSVPDVELDRTQVL